MTLLVIIIAFMAGTFVGASLVSAMVISGDISRRERDA